MVRKNIPVNTTGENLSTFGGRLSYERKRVGFTVHDFAIQCGVTKQTQIKYEGNKNNPDVEYLQAAMTRGVDVMYLLTGDRSAEAIPAEHQNLIEAYVAAPEDLRRAAFAVLVSPHLDTIGRAKHDPGYFQHEILGQEDSRYRSSGNDSPEVFDMPANIGMDLPVGKIKT